MIGNWIDATQLGGYAEVTEIKAGSVKVKDFDFGILCERNNPIPLDPAILEKCGFVNGWGDDWGWFECLEKRGFQLFIDKDTKVCTHEWGNNKVEIKYLHTLQNLYFARFSSPLKIEL